jgi:hypothetical protein
MMPRDVTTRWNSTYNMLAYALEYKEPIDTMCDNRKYRLQHLSLDEEEWTVVTQLSDVLKV